MLSLYNEKRTDEILLIVRDQDGKEQFKIKLHPYKAVNLFSHPTDDVPEIHGWQFLLSQLQKFLVDEPTRLSIYLRATVDREELLGHVAFYHLIPPPLNAAMIEALKADPFAAQALRLTINCNACGEGVRAYTALERIPEMEVTGWTWQLELPERFECKCKKTNISLEYIKSGLHAFLFPGQLFLDQEISVVSMYEQSALQKYCADLGALLRSEPEKEETLHRFLDDHKVFLHRFAAKLIISKAPILSKFVADFVILNNRNELLLIEIERSTVRLLKKTTNSFGVTASLEHAMDQVRSWRQLFDDHRDAVLSNLDIERKQVAKIKGIVVVGRTPADPEELRYLRGLNLDVEIYTYDDLISDVVEAIKHIGAA